ncbi:MAG: ATP-binding protein [Saprospiraceae bacterium]|nr:ATP-binding protein [Saprospiraceae bacterium]
MKITKIKVQNFRSISNAEIHCNDFNVFVGQNNAGKTNLFEAIEWFYNGLGKNTQLRDICYNRDTSLIVQVEIEFKDAQKGILRMKNERNATALKNALKENDSVIIRRTSTDHTKRKIIIDSKELEKLPTGFDTSLNDFLPKFEYIHTRQYYDALTKYTKTTPIGVMLSGVLGTILEGSKQYRDFKDKFQELFGNNESEVKIEFDKLANKVKINLEKQFPDCTKVSFEVFPPIFEDLLKNFETTVDDGIETTAAEKGDGMQRALMLAIIQAYAEYRRANEDIGKSFLFFIDEAELHLHPTAQRKLKNVLLELSETLDQIFINTHSSVLVVDEHTKQSIFKVEKIYCETQINRIEEIEKPYIVYELLGGSPSDLLLPHNFLIVEGSSELEFLSRIIKRFYPDKPRIQIISANGDTDQASRTINAVEQSFTPLNKSLYGNKVIILCDKPSPEKEGAVKNFETKYKTLKKNGQIIYLPTRSLEEYYPKGSVWHRTSEDEDAMSGHKKKQLGKKAGDEIAKEQFESEMIEILNSLEKCWGAAFDTPSV